MKKFAALLAVLVAVCLLCVSDASAKGGKKNKAPLAADVFAQLDKNNDGKLSLEEYKAGKTDTEAADAEKTFKALDTDKDGFLSLDEYKAGNPDPVKKHKKNK